MYASMYAHDHTRITDPTAAATGAAPPARWTQALPATGVTHTAGTRHVPPAPSSVTPGSVGALLPHAALGTALRVAAAAGGAPRLARCTAARPCNADRLVIEAQRRVGNQYVQRLLTQRASIGGRQAPAPEEVEAGIERTRGAGQALDSGARAQLEPAFGADFGRVRVHADADADQLSQAVDAEAFTTGPDIYFRQGAYSPGTSGGRALLAHELTHVLQQDGPAIQGRLAVSDPGDAYEQEAEQIAHAVMRQLGDPSAQPLPDAAVGAPVLQRAPAAETTYVVQPGDSLKKIAARFGVSVEDLKRWNAAKLRTWSTPRGPVQGFDSGVPIVVGGAAATTPEAGTAPPREPEQAEPPGLLEGVVEAVSGAGRAVKEAVGGMVEDIAEAATGAWESAFGGEAAAVPAAPGSSAAPGATTPAGPAPAAAAPAASTPQAVIDHHNTLGTFGEGVQVRVTSTKRDAQKQLDILRQYCKNNKAALDTYAESTDWLKGELDWDAFETCSLSDQETWLPFFFALYYGGGGPGTSSANRTLPLVGSPVQATWKGKAANASPHLAGKAMDVKDGDLEALAATIKTGVPEFGAAGAFPVKSTQIENVQGQKVVHINFKNVVF